MESEKKVLGIVLVNWNNINLTNNILTDLSKQVDMDFHATLYEQNSSEVGTKETLEEWSNASWLTIVRNMENVDLNRLWNQFANQTQYDYICFLNNDVRVRQFFTHDIKIALGLDNVGCVIHPTNRKDKNKYTTKPQIEILRSPRYQGWDFAIRRDCFEDIPQNFRIFAGDNFLFGMVVKKGYKIALANSSPIIHYKERTRRKNPDIRNIHRTDVGLWLRMVAEGKVPNVAPTVPSLSIKYPSDDMTLISCNNATYTILDESRIGDLPIMDGRGGEQDCIAFSKNGGIAPYYNNGWRIIPVGGEFDEQQALGRLAFYEKTTYIDLGHKHEVI